MVLESMSCTSRQAIRVHTNARKGCLVIHSGGTTKAFVKSKAVRLVAGILQLLANDPAETQKLFRIARGIFWRAASVEPS